MRQHTRVQNKPKLLTVYSYSVQNNNLRCICSVATFHRQSNTEPPPGYILVLAALSNRRLEIYSKSWLLRILAEFHGWGVGVGWGGGMCVG